MVRPPSRPSKPEAARTIDVRGGRPVRAGTFELSAGDEVVTGWHAHDIHQLEYALEGVVEVETERHRFLLPPRQAVWIPAGVDHCTTLNRVKTVSAFFDPALPIPAGDRVRVIAAAPVLREMILYARRWPIHRGCDDARADGYFDTLATLIVEALEHEIPLRLPTSRHPIVSRALRYTAEHLADVSLSEVCSVVSLSERGFRRLFAAETAMPWRQYVLEARLLRATALLSDPDNNVLSVANAVGFRSLSAFTRAFGRYVGEPPGAFRHRVTRCDERPARQPAAAAAEA